MAIAWLLTCQFWLFALRKLRVNLAAAYSMRSNSLVFYSCPLLAELLSASNYCCLIFVINHPKLFWECWAGGAPDFSACLNNLIFQILTQTWNEMIPYNSRSQPRNILLKLALTYILKWVTLWKLQKGKNCLYHGTWHNKTANICQITQLNI